MSTLKKSKEAAAEREGGEEVRGVPSGGLLHMPHICF